MMAKAPKAKSKAAAPVKSSTFNRILLLSMAVFFGLMLLPTVFYLSVAMLPTLAAFLVDKSREKYQWVCVGGLNFAGASPALIELWTQRNDMETATRQISDVLNIMSAYGASAFGWMLFLSLPPIMTMFMSMTSQRRITTLKSTQSRLIQVWGEEVSMHKH